METSEAVAIYTRVSTDIQVDGYSLDAQESVLREDAKRRGKWVYGVYSDPGVSGASANRPGLKKLLEDARRGFFGEILVWNISRVSRNLKQFLQFIDETERLGVVFRSIAEGFDISTVIGRFGMTMVGAIAQMQRDSWTESSRIGMRSRCTSGRWNGGTVLGYCSVPDPDDPKGGTKLEIIPEEAEIVRAIFAMYDAGLGYKAILNRINGKGFRTKNGNLFAPINIKIILENPLYVGKVRFAGKLGAGIHEPIVSPELWERVQQRRKERSQRSSKLVEREYLLSGLLRCPECGGPMVPNHINRTRKNGTKRVNHYYHCNKYLGQGTVACRSNRVNADRVEEEVMQRVTRFLSEPEWIERVIERIKKKQQVAKMSFQERAMKLADIGRKERELLILFENEKLTMDQIKARRQELKEIQAELDKDFLTDSEHVPQWTEKELRQAMTRLQRVLEAAPAIRKRELLRSLVQRIEIDRAGGVVNIEFHPISMKDSGRPECGFG